MEFFILSIQFVRIDISGRTKYNYYVILCPTLSNVNKVCFVLPCIYGESKSKKITLCKDLYHTV